MNPSRIIGEYKAGSSGVDTVLLRPLNRKNRVKDSQFIYYFFLSEFIYYVAQRVSLGELEIFLQTSDIEIP
jgi:hypothetical protein